MAERGRWQYCQVEVGASSAGTLRQFFADREMVQTDLSQNWPGMLGKLGEQGWELVSVLPNDGGRGRVYAFKRPM